MLFWSVGFGLASAGIYAFTFYIGRGIGTYKVLFGGSTNVYYGYVAMGVFTIGDFGGRFYSMKSGLKVCYGVAKLELGAYHAIITYIYMNDDACYRFEFGLGQGTITIGVSYL